MSEVSYNGRSHLWAITSYSAHYTWCWARPVSDSLVSYFKFRRITASFESLVVLAIFVWSLEATGQGPWVCACVVISAIRERLRHVLETGAWSSLALMYETLNECHYLGLSAVMHVQLLRYVSWWCPMTASSWRVHGKQHMVAVFSLCAGTSCTAVNAKQAK